MTRWLHEVDVSEPWNSDGISLENKVLSIVRIMKDSTWYKAHLDDPDTYFYNIVGWVEELEYGVEGIEVEDFDAMWSDMYDMADRDRVWINIWKRKDPE